MKCVSLVFLASLCLFAGAGGLPSSVNWKDKGVLPPVRSQGELGDSKGVGIVEAIEAIWAIKHRGKITLSLTEYENCCKNASDSYKCIVNIGGLARDDDYPRDSKTCVYQQYKPVVQLAGGVSVPHGDEMALAEAVVSQPVAVAVDASRISFEYYKSGVYSDPMCSSVKVDHVMLVVGFGSEEGVDYWLCQNSWGTSWGMDGFIKIARNSNNMCGIATSASFPIVL